MESGESDNSSFCSSSSLGTEWEENKDDNNFSPRELIGDTVHDSSALYHDYSEELVSLSQLRLMGPKEQRHFDRQERQRATNHAIDLALEDIVISTSDPRTLSEYITQLSEIRGSLIHREEKLSKSDKTLVMKTFWERFEKRCQQYQPVSADTALATASIEFEERKRTLSEPSAVRTVALETSEPSPIIDRNYELSKRAKVKLKPSLATQLNGERKEEEDVVYTILSPTSRTMQNPESTPPNISSKPFRTSTPRRRRATRRRRQLDDALKSQNSFFTTQNGTLETKW